MWLLIAFGAGSLTTFLVYWFLFWPPNPFPSNRQVVQEINRTYEEAEAKVIQDILFIDSHHVVVPYISANEDYGLSYWRWRNHKWQVISIDTKGEPKVWKVNGDDPTSFALVWNAHPDDQLQAIQFYFLRNRNYGMTNGVEHYSPRIQMEKKISLREKSYGILKLPKDWALVLNSVLIENRGGKSSLFFNDFFPLQNAYFGWLPYDQSGKETFPKQTVNGHTYVVDDIDQEHVMILNTVDIEIPK